MIDLSKNIKTKKKNNIKGIQEPKSAELAYLKQLKKLTKQLKDDVRQNILPLLKGATIDSLTNDSVFDVLAALKALSLRYDNLLTFSETTSSQIVNQINNSNKARFYKNVQNSTGIDLEQVVAEEGLSDIIALQKNKNESLIKSIPQEFIKNIEVVVQNGISEGLRPEEIARQIKGIKGIKSVFGKLDNRVKLIAKNETLSINAALAKKRAENVGITEAIWRTSKDERVRDCHQARDGKKYELSKGLFSSCDGKTIYPGQEVNCFKGDSHLNHTTMSNYFFRRWYAGKLAVLAFNDGSVLETTPNHPIMTERGWVSAQDIKMGENVVKISNESIYGIKDNTNCFIPTFEQIFNSFVECGVPTVISPSANGKFHGDISDGKIDIISTDSLLIDKINSQIIEKINSLNLSMSNMFNIWVSLTCQGRGRKLIFTPDSSPTGFVSLLDLLCSDFLAHLTPLQCFCFTLGSWGYSVFNKDSVYDISTDTKDFRNCIDAFSSLVFSKDFIERQIDLVRSNLVFGKIKTDLLKPTKEGSIVDTKFEGDTFDSVSTKYELLSLKDSYIRDFSGHIYNLENKLNYYSVSTPAGSNIMVSNCRCIAEYIIN
jgi:SPP1 gp7 family putative phage head morphogenesis protein